MTLYRTGVDRFKKWSAKFVPDTVRDRFAQVKDVASDRAEAGLLKYADMQDLIRPILDKYGVAGPDRAKYIGFANKLLKHISRASGEAMTKIAQGLKSYYVQAYNADPAILDEIINVVAGIVYPY